MNKSIKAKIIKLSPLIIVYFLFLIKFISNLDYEAIIILIVLIPLIVYIFNKDLKIERILRYFLYLSIAGLAVYIYNLFLMAQHWLSFCIRNYANGDYSLATIWSFLKSVQFYIYDLKYLIYVGIIFLAIKNKKREMASLLPMAKYFGLILTGVVILSMFLFI